MAEFFLSSCSSACEFRLKTRKNAIKFNERTHIFIFAIAIWFVSDVNSYTCLCGVTANGSMKFIETLNCQPNRKVLEHDLDSILECFFDSFFFWISVYREIESIDKMRFNAFDDRGHLKSKEHELNSPDKNLCRQNLFEIVFECKHFFSRMVNWIAVMNIKLRFTISGTILTRLKSRTMETTVLTMFSALCIIFPFFRSYAKKISTSFRCFPCKCVFRSRFE